MASDRIQGLAENYALFVTLSDAAHDVLAEELQAIGEQAVAAQQAAAPVLTGKLRAAVTVAEALGMLRVRAGYPNLKSGRDPLFYAVFQEYGVEAGQKWVKRLNKRAGRTVKVGRYKKYPVEYYVMNWKSRPGRHFIHIEDRIADVVDTGLARFWDIVLDRAIGQAGASA